MAKILYVVPVGQDMGGIITSSEELMTGFRLTRHKPTFALLRSGNSTGGEPRGKHADDYVPGAGSGLMVHPVHGWRGPCYSTARPDEFLHVANKHDIVIFAALYGLRNKDTEGTTEWARCITECTAKIIFMVRDDHLEKRVPWAMALAPYATAWAGVQQCSVDSCAGLGRVGLVYSGHGPAHPDALRSRRSGAIAIATWKPWKRGRALLAAAPGLEFPLTVAGDGIEFRYMRSPDKARPKDFHEDGRRIWDAAIGAGVNYVGCVSEAERDTLLLKNKFLIDLSLRHNSGQINRVMVEAARHGCIPIADPRFVAKEFMPEENYIPILSDCPPQGLDTLLNDIYTRTSARRLGEMRAANVALVDQFSREKAAEALVALAKGRAGRIDKAKLEQGRAAFAEVFGEL